MSFGLSITIITLLLVLFLIILGIVNLVIFIIGRPIAAKAASKIANRFEIKNRFFRFTTFALCGFMTTFIPSVIAGLGLAKLYDIVLHRALPHLDF